MQIQVILSFLVVCSIGTNALTTSNAGCDANEEYKCGSACFESCLGIPNICTMQWVCGCVCQAGYVRQNTSRTSPCVKRESCPPQGGSARKCGVNEVYAECGSACPLTCADLKYDPNRELTACPAVCVPGCTCRSGFYRSANGTCVAPAQCCRGSHEVYRSAGPRCQRTCPPSNSTCTNTSTKGCFCQANYVRKEARKNSRCIRLDQC